MQIYTVTLTPHLREIQLDPNASKIWNFYFHGIRIISAKFEVDWRNLKNVYTYNTTQNKKKRVSTFSFFLFFNGFSA